MNKDQIHKKIQGLIFSGWQGSNLIITPQPGPYRIRTFLEENGYNIEIIDHIELWKLPELLNVIEKFSENLLFVGFSMNYLKQLPDNLLSTIKLRWSHIKIILGGQEVNLGLIKDEMFADKAIFGYSENAILHYLDFLLNKREDLKWTFDEKSNVDYVIADKQIPYTNTDDLHIKWKSSDPFNKRSLCLETSRGCIFKCLFCSYPLIGKKRMDYLRGIENMADEFKYNYENFGTTHYSFMDDTLNESVSKLEHINKAIKKSNVPITFNCYMRIDLVISFPEMIDLMIDMGFKGGFLGIESLDETVRKKIGKGLSNDKIFNCIDSFRQKTDRIWFEGGFIIGLPGETIESNAKTHKWLIDQKHRYFDTWIWNPLYIARYSKWLRSPFSDKYTAYGYRFKHPDVFNNEWDSDIMTFKEAETISNIFNNESKKYQGISSWFLQNLLNYGMEWQEINNVNFIHNLDLNSLKNKKIEIINQYKKSFQMYND